MHRRGDRQTSRHLPGKVLHERRIDGPERVIDPIQINDGVPRNGRPIFKVAPAIADGRSPIVNRLQRQAMGPADDRPVGIQTTGPVFEQRTIPDRVRFGPLPDGGCCICRQFPDRHEYG